ncbi:MAG TPA: hypothetical protein VLB75_04395 [Steroidobacteraceae bacterium]|nr:hypothetical protein [Steroidobacteraceae bacterium]
MTASDLRTPLIGVLVGGGIAATLDLVYAILRQAGFGGSPLWTLQSVASGWLGEGAFTSGALGGVIGLVSHYGILLVAAAIYLAASKRVHILQTHALASGALFGVLVYLFMNFVVLPLSAFPYPLSYPPLRLLEGFVSHAIFVGIPIALAIRRSAPIEPRPAS